MGDKVVVFGAGATGRGHVGLLCWQAGAELVFVDSRPDLVECLRRAGTYRVQLFSGSGSQIVDVSGFRIYHAEDRAAVAHEITGAAAVLTAVFDQNLPHVGQTLALAAGACRAAGRTTPLNCIACENMMDSSSSLARHVHAYLASPSLAEDLAYCQRFFAFPDSMISRVVPVPEPDPLLILTEDYNEWTARAEAFEGPRPSALAALELVVDQTARLERKLFIHNGAHAVCGYVGHARGWRYIHEAVGDHVVAEHVLGALDELGAVVERKHGFPHAEIKAYQQDLVRRGAIAELRDEIGHVVRDPIRKLSPRERLVAPALLAVEYDLPRRWIVRGIIAALRCHNPADAQAALLTQKLAHDGLSAVLAEVSGILPGSPLAAEIQDAWDGGAWDGSAWGGDV